MIYPYMTLPDGLEICHTQVFEENGQRKVEVHFEKPVEGGFQTARCQLPSYTWLVRDGFSDQDMEALEQLVRNNAQLFFGRGESMATDPFYSPSNMQRVQRNIATMESGNASPHDVIEVD